MDRGGLGQAVGVLEHPARSRPPELEDLQHVAHEAVVGPGVVGAHERHVLRHGRHGVVQAALVEQEVDLLHPVGAHGVDPRPRRAQHQDLVQSLLRLPAELRLVGLRPGQADVVHLPHVRAAPARRVREDLVGQRGGRAGQADDEHRRLDALPADLGVLGLEAPHQVPVLDAGLHHVLHGEPADAAERVDVGDETEEAAQVLEFALVLLGEVDARIGRALRLQEPVEEAVGVVPRPRGRGGEGVDKAQSSGGPAHECPLCVGIRRQKGCDAFVP